MDKSGGPARSEIQDQPLAAGDEIHDESLAPAAPDSQSSRPSKKKLSWREARRKRRKSRKRGEEILAWVLVPAIVIGLWFAASAVFDFFGTSPGQVWDQLQQVKAALEKKAQSK